MKKLLSKVVLSLQDWYKSNAVTYSFSSVCKRLGEIFFHTYSQACSIPFVLCEISTKGLESRLAKSAAASPWEKGSPGASMPAEPAIPHQQHTPALQKTEGPRSSCWLWSLPGDGKAQPLRNAAGEEQQSIPHLPQNQVPKGPCCVPGYQDPTCTYTLQVYTWILSNRTY